MGWQIGTMDCGIEANIVRMKGLFILLVANQVELIQIKTSPMASDSTICITKDGIKERNCRHNPHLKQNQVLVFFKYILTNIWNGASRSAFGEGTCCTTESSNEDIFFALSGGLLVKVKEAHPSLADA